MALNYRLNYTGDKVNELLGTINDLDLTPYMKKSDFRYITATPQSGETDTVALNRVSGSQTLVNGNIGIVIKTIDEDLKSYTGYVYYNNEWRAMDGNYNAENVYLDENLIYTSDIGELKVPSGSTYGTLESKGKSVEAVLKSIMSVEKQPNVTQPSITLGIKYDTTPITKNYSVENGSIFYGTYNITTNVGAYSYDNSTGVTFSTYQVDWYCNGSKIEGTTKTSQTGDYNTISIDKGKSYCLKASANHTDGSQPHTNLGHESTAQAISAGTKIANSYIITGYQMGMFYGTLTDVVAKENIDSAKVRSLEKNNSSKNDGTFEFDVPAGAKTIVIAVADTETGARTLSTVLNTTVNANMTNSFSKRTGVVVAGADNSITSGNQGYYTIWTYSPAEAYTTSARLKVTIS